MSMVDIGINKEVRSVFRMISEDKKNNISSFFDDHFNNSYFEFKDVEQIVLRLGSSEIDNYNSELLRMYSGYNFRNINSVLRGNWNYEKNGHESKKTEYEGIARELTTFIDNNQKSIGNCKAFRGVPLHYFKSYGIDNLQDLVYLEDNFIFDKGLVSTSLIEDKCFFKKDNDLGINYNVKIEYLIPEEFEDGIYLGDYNSSYSPEQYEYVINSWNMAKVYSVDVDGDSAVVKAMMIPKKVYDDYYSHEGRIVK